MTSESRRFALLALTVAALVLVGCAAAQRAKETVTGWFGSPAPRAFYVGAAKAKLREEPDPSARIVGELPRRQGVLAYQVRNGFAFVRAEGSGRSGWVSFADLVDTLPPVSKPSPAVTPSAAPVPEPAPDAEVGTSESSPSEPAPTEPGATEPEPETPPEPPERSVFDPY